MERDIIEVKVKFLGCGTLEGLGDSLKLVEHVYIECLEKNTGARQYREILREAEEDIYVLGQGVDYEERQKQFKKHGGIAPVTLEDLLRTTSGKMGKYMLEKYCKENDQIIEILSKNKLSIREIRRIAKNHFE